MTGGRVSDLTGPPTETSTLHIVVKMGRICIRLTTHTSIHQGTLYWAVLPLLDLSTWQSFFPNTHLQRCTL